VAIVEVASNYAPMVVLHADDKLRPSSAEWFIERSALRWATGRGLDGDAVPDAPGDVDAGRLGVGGSDPYSYGDYVATSLTRPLDDNAARQGRPPLEQGFFLRLKEQTHVHGDKGTSNDPSVYAGTTTYWDYDENAGALTYWLFYPGSSPPLGILRASEQIGVRGRDAAGAPSDEQCPPELGAAVAAAQLEEFRHVYPGLAAQVDPGERTRGLTDTLERLRAASEGVRALLRDDDVLHEGDWERITLYLDESDPEGSEPHSVVFYRHSTNTSRKWSAVDKDGKHPVVYCAIGSHASLPSPGYGFIDVGDANGPRWRTWKDLAPVEEQPWYGFGGAWGRLGRVRESTGPLGPAAHWKLPAPRPSI
jgi:hypothetical protein